MANSLREALQETATTLRQAGERDFTDLQAISLVRLLKGMTLSEDHLNMLADLSAAGRLTDHEMNALDQFRGLDR